VPNLDPLATPDHIEEAVVEMLKKKQAGIPVSREHRRRGANAVRARARCCFPLRARANEAIVKPAERSSARHRLITCGAQAELGGVRRAACRRA